MPFQPASSPIMRTENIHLSAPEFIDKDEDATDSTDIVTQAYVEKYSAVITPTAWMKLYAKSAVLVVEYIIKTDPGAGTVTVQTLVDGADAVEKTLLNIAAGVQTSVHTDILAVALAAGTSYTVSLEAKNTDAGQTSVIDYCNIYLQLGTSSSSYVTLAIITSMSCIRFDLLNISGKVWSGAVDSAIVMLHSDDLSSLFHATGSTISGTKSVLTTGTSTSIDDDIRIKALTDNVDNPTIITTFYYCRVWFE